MSKETLSINTNVEGQFKLACPGDCRAATWHRPLASADVSGSESSWDYHYGCSYQIVQCQGCHSISYRTTSWNSEDVFHDEDAPGLVAVITTELYPRRIEGRAKLREIRHLPTNVTRIYEETISALANEQPVLAGIGIRALVETICKDKQASGRTLEGQIDDLVVKATLTADGAEILHSLRIMGNAAAHEVRPLDEDDLVVALDVVDNLLMAVYILPAMSKRLPRRRDLNSDIT
jgi:hypothetical protein